MSDQTFAELMATPRMDVGGTDPYNMLAGLKDMLDYICRVRVPYRMVEIGCFHGVSTELFCRNIPFVVAIDRLPQALVTRQAEGFIVPIP